MKKRLLLLLAFGISFAPPVFADGMHDSYAMGELKLSQMDLRAANCPFQGLKDLSANTDAEQAESEIRSVRSGIAR